MFLQKVPPFKNPHAALEQYQTPASIVADIIYTAFCSNDLVGKHVVDLGCGTGIFAFGAAIAHASKVIGIDIDERSIKDAKAFAKEHDLSVLFLRQDITSVENKADTVLMNPPFGAQKTHVHADRLFMEKAFEIAPVIYSLHLSSTIPFITSLINALQGEITFRKTYIFPLKGAFSFHEKLLMNIDVTLLRTIHVSD